jgi:hypothetical protein
MSWPRFGHGKKWKRRESCVREISWPESCVCLCETHSNRKAESLLVVPALIMHVCAFAFPVKLETAIAWEVAARPPLRIITSFTTDHPPVDNCRSLPLFTARSLSASTLTLQSRFALAFDDTTPATTIMNH